MRDLIVALLAEGHVLIEDAPGVGKTALARSLARSLEAEYARVQCTSDLLPADLVGTNVFNQREARFDFHPGPVFANVVLVDEINRASPKTQSGLLECMQERQITIDGTKHELARPFLVLATQNPASSRALPAPGGGAVASWSGRSGTAGRWRRGEPRRADDTRSRSSPDRGRDDGSGRPGRLAEVRGSEALRGYVVSICDATRADERVELGASPRAGLMLFRASKALAALEGRDHVLPDDVSSDPTPSPRSAPARSHRGEAISGAGRRGRRQGPAL